jgi:hypothetical protein
VFSYLNGLLQVSVKYQYPTYIGYKTQLPNGNQLLLLPVPQGTSQSGIACATLLDYDLLPYLISEVMAPTGGPYCQGFYNTFAIYNGFIVFDLPPPGAFVSFSLNASLVMPDVFAIAISTNNGTLAYVLQDITLPQNILSQLPIGAGYWSSGAFTNVLGRAGAQYQFITLDSVVNNGQPSAYEYWTYIPYPSQINNFYSGYPPPTSLLNAGYFFNLLNDLYIPVSQITQVTGVQAYNPGPIGVVYSPNAITQTSTNLNGYSYKYYTYDQLQAIWQQNEAPDTVTFYDFLGAIGIFSLNKVNTVIVSPRGTLSQLLQWAQQNKQINGYNALFPGPIPF